MLVIRLSRQGRKNLAHYKLLVQEKTNPVKSGKYIEIVGHYDPNDADNKLTFDKDRIEHYLKNGAQPSDTVARLLKKAGIENAAKFIKKYTHQVNEEKLKAEQEAKEAAAAEAKAKKEAEAAEKEAAAAAEKEAAEAPAEEKAEDAPAPAEKEEPADEASSSAEATDDKPAEKAAAEEKPAE